MSPYLLQHAHNPVDWFPWGSEALEKSKKENKPIFLSIGYATCHWCHVMEHESFENEEIAKLLNEYFVPIKVDREERPDLDAVYMKATIALTGSGGWPMNVFLTPQHKPFFAGTYFPPDDSNVYGRMGFKTLLTRINEAWKNQNEEILKSAEQILSSLKNKPDTENFKNFQLSEDIFKKAFMTLHQSYDGIHGGFGRAPKFPMGHQFSFLLHHFYYSKEIKALDITQYSLAQMAFGGIYDQLGGGFSRYSTDDKWLVPHFEKMLYDNGLLAKCYLECFQITQNVFFKEVAEDIFKYILRDMTAPTGGFYSAEDADSEGVEGKFYVWEFEEIQKLLTKPEFDFVYKYFHIYEHGNWEENNILFCNESLNEFIQKNPEFNVELANTVKQKLFDYRSKRIRPLLDDKILTSWNGLMITAMALGYKTTGERKYLEAAVKAVEFINLKMTDAKGLMRSSRNGQSKIPAFLEDYVFLTQGLIYLWEATQEIKYLKQAIDLQNQTNIYFWNDQEKIFKTLNPHGEKLIMEEGEDHDGAIPTGNSVALFNLQKLGHYLGDTKLLNQAENLIESSAVYLEHYPSGFCQRLIGTQLAFYPMSEVVVVAPTAKDPDFLEVQKYLKGKFLPNVVYFLITPENEKSFKETIPALADKNAIDNKTTIYFCQNFSCKQPIFSLEELKNNIKA